MSLTGVTMPLSFRRYTGYLRGIDLAEARASFRDARVEQLPRVVSHDPRADGVNFDGRKPAMTTFVRVSSPSANPLPSPAR
jgi:hypothetical protein